MSQQGNWKLDLSPNDQRLLDELVDVGFDVDALESVTDKERERIDRLQRLLGLMHDYPVDDADETLLDATMARIDQYRERLQLHAVKGEAERPRGFTGFRFRFQDFIGVAAALLLAASVALPVLNTVRQNSLDQRCANNMRYVGYAFGSYAADHNGAMPTATASLMHPSPTWDKLANVVNLAPLIEGQYCSHGHLNCPGNHSNLNLSYSYQWQRPGTRMTWGIGRVSVVLGDRNPLMDAARKGAVLPANSMSLDHGGRGQNVLATDGATMWLGNEPVVGRDDNIWLPHGFSRLEPGVKTRSHDDVFLAH